MSYEKINITDLSVIIALAIALIMAIFYNRTDLSMNIVSGMIGYIGGTRAIKGGEEKCEK